MAIKQRKQVTGTTEQINAYAGVEGQLVWNKTTKRLVGMSGTAGINYPMASERHQHSIANVTGLQNALDGKLATTAKIPYSQITGTPSIPDVSGLIPKTRDRGILAGYEASRPGTTVNATASDTMFTSKNFTVQPGSPTITEAWTKVVTMTGGSITLGNNWSWASGSAPTLKYPGILVCHWDGGANHGIASYIPGVS